MKKYPLLQKIGNILTAAADRISMLAQKAEALPGKVPEILALLVYAAAHLGMAIVHEPWFDEAEAWQIARCVSLRTLILETTHYEGHPPLWHLILMPLAKAGAPYELSLTLVSLLFMGTAVFLILWYAPFPRLVRLLLPFTYFFFYQYGVISRVYCVMVLEFVLLAMAYRRRNMRPGRYVVLLILLCMTMAYGIVIAGGLAIVWLWEIWNEGAWKRPGSGSESRQRSGGGSSGRTIWDIVRGYAADRRIWWLALLLAAALVVIWMIVPRADTFAAVAIVSNNVSNSFIVRLIYTFFVMPSDGILTDIYSDSEILSQAFLMPSAMIGGALFGIMIWGILLYYGKKRGTNLLLVLPYGFLAVFAAAVYMWTHHIGIGLLYFCFWCWVSAESGERCAGLNQLGEKQDERIGRLPARKRFASAVRCAAILLGTLSMAVSLFWTGAACTLDIRKSYAPGRREAVFIKEHHLDRYRIMSGWETGRDEKGNIVYADINMCDRAVNPAPYFKHNLFFNFNGGKDERNYITHIHLSMDETQKQYEIWSREELPQVLWMWPELSEVYGDQIAWQDYVLVYRDDIWKAWKAGADYYGSDIRVRRELLEETGCVPLE